MGKKSKAAVAAAGAVSTARENPYVQRVMEDDDLRDNVKVAFEAARDAYERLSSGKTPAKVIQDDKKFYQDLQTAAGALKDAGSALRDAPKKKAARKRGHSGRKLVLLVVGAALALALSSDLRSKLLDALFGAEEEFNYTATAAPSA
jgi:SspJ family small acid-soluble spore protein